MNKTEKLNLEIIEGPLIVPNKSGFYHDALRTWFDHFGLNGRGLIVGDRQGVKLVLKSKYHKITEIFNVSLHDDTDINWDITKSHSGIIPKFNWIICQAVLEHVEDPVSSMKNFSDILIKKGLLFLHVPAFGYGYHAFPIDYYRFSIDTLKAFENLTELNLIDSFCDSKRVMAVYRKDN